MTEKKTAQEFLNDKGLFYKFKSAREALKFIDAMESYALYKSKEAETERRFLLEGYSEYLEEHGFMDSDWREEEPFPIDEFLNSNKR